MRGILFLTTLIFISCVSFAQDTLVTKKPAKLPFAIANEKRLSDEDLSHKKEGFYVAGIPEISSDPVNGFGYGVEGSLFFNGKRSDPFFAYTPYRGKLDIVLFNTTRQQREVSIKLDVPYVFDTKWRLRVEAVYETNPNLLYFGTTEKSLHTLAHPYTGKQYQRYNDYEQSLKYTRPGTDAEPVMVTDNFYNVYNKDELILNISAERSYFDSKMRLLAGYEIADINITTFDNTIYNDAINPNTGQNISAPNGTTKLRNDYNNNAITGYGRGLISMFQVGAVWDTRDLEPDPSKGLFAEITDEFSSKAVGSKYNFNKVFAQAKYYHPLFPKLFGKLILATRIGMGYTGGQAPFFEYQDEWSSEGSIEGLGGAHTIRGYKQARFLGRVMNFANVELRCRFAQAHFLKQHFSFSAVPFFDAGGVWNKFSSMGNLKNYRYAPGGGLRIAWNVNTILRFDYAVSKEDAQFFFNIGHSF